MIPAHSSHPVIFTVTFTLESKRGVAQSSNATVCCLSTTFTAEMLECVALFTEFCQVFGLPVGQQPQNFFYRIANNTLLFNGTGFKLDDERALALSCALLKSHHMSELVMHEFVMAYLEAAKESRFCTTVRDALATNRFNSVKLKNPSNRIVLPCFHWNFSKSLFTGLGASLLIATAVILSNGMLVVDMSTCPILRYIELMPWSDVVNEIRFSTSSVKFGLRGLRLNNCPLRNFGRRPGEVLNGLDWLSFRGTRVRNLWTVSSILRDLPSLRAVLMSGSTNDLKPETRMFAHLDDDDRVVDRSSKRKTSLRHELSKRDEVGPSHGNDLPARVNRTATRGVHTASRLPNLLTLKEVRESGIPYLEISALTAPRDLQLPDEGYSVPTPVTTNPHYRSFLLVHSKSSLISLDGVIVTENEIDSARQTIQHNFELPVRDISKPVATISSLLRNREVALSQTRYMQGKPTYRLESTPKRRRNSHYGLSGYSRAGSSDFRHVARAASGCVNSHGQSKQSLSPCGASPNTSSVRELGFVNIESKPRLVQENLDRLQPERLPYTESNFNHRCFEGACANELLSKTGAPHIEYYCKPTDRPRQFEYNPIDTRLLVYGTEHANLIVLNQETMSVAASCKVGGGPGLLKSGTSFLEDFHELPALRSAGPGLNDVGRRRKSVLGLSWFNKDPNMFISGCEDGSIHVYNVDRMSKSNHGGCVRESLPFRDLTSLHTNCVDEKFLVSGYSTSVGLFDLETGLTLENIDNCHMDHINVLKFAHNNPNVFVTSSFDKTVKKWDLRERRPGGTRRPIFECNSETGNVMVCFSLDDKYFLVSGVDNEVKQYCASDGRLERSFDIPKSNSKHNYTRSYYMNGGDYIISGSCAEDVVRVYNARTGCLFKEIDLDNRSGHRDGLIFVQSLRSNPRREYNFSALLSSNDIGPYNILANVSLLERE